MRSIRVIASMAALILLTSRLILVPTTQAISLPSYVDFYRNVVSDARVTSMGWGDATPRTINVEDGLSILRKKNEKTWNIRGFGDFGAAELPEALKSQAPQSAGGWVELQTIPDGVDLNTLRWVGYGCIRSV